MNNTSETLMDSVRSAWQANNPDTAGWLSNLQQQALDNFADTGFPSTRDEDWKYTDIAKVAAAYPDSLAPHPNSTGSAFDGLLEIADAIRLIFIDGEFKPELSTEDLPAGLLVGSLADLMKQEPEALEKLLGSLAKSSDSGFIALNTALTTSATALLLADNTELTQPIYICHVATAADTSSHTRLLVSVGVHGKASIVEHFAGAAAAIVNSVSEFHCAQGAALSYCKLQENAADAWHTASQYLYLERDARSSTTTIDMGSAICRNELRVQLAGQGAHADAKGLILADGSRHIDSRIHVEHIAPNTTSRERYRSILADKARGVFNGKILVQQDAQKTAAELTNRNLLLNPGAEINTKPELEIYADDVKCAHGSTTGQLDDNSLFYLMSRGVTPLEARNLLVRAFAAELLTDIEFTAVVERTSKALESLRFSP